MCILRLVSQVRKYDGFTPGKRVSGRKPKLPIWTADIPSFRYFTNPNDSQVTQTHDASLKVGETQAASLEIDSQWIFSLSLRPSCQELESGEFFLRQAGYFYRKSDGNKVDWEWHGQGIIIGRFWGNFSPARYRVNTIEADLNDLRYASEILDILGCDWTMHLHMANTNSQCVI